MNNVIKLNGAEIQSAFDRVKHAEHLIDQLPHNHDGRNSWLLNYGRGHEATLLRQENEIEWNEHTQSAMTIGDLGIRVDFDFSYALNLLKEGKRVCRSNWNGKGMYLYIVEIGIPGYDQSTDVFHIKSQFIVMRTADDKLIPWLASQTDLLANDWNQVVE